MNLLITIFKMTEECDGGSCPIIKLISFISKKWVLLIMKSLNSGCGCYSDIEKDLNTINPRILSARLKELQEFGFIEKKIISDTPIKSMYRLTEKGKSFTKNIDDMVEWTKKWM